MLLLLWLAPVAGCAGQTPSASVVAPASSVAPAAPFTVVPVVSPGAPLEVHLTRPDVRVTVAPDPCPVVNGMLDPDRAHVELACYYTAADKPYVLPSSQAPDVVVLAGHTSRTAQGAFNALYDWQQQQFSVQVGDELRVRTTTSGTSWLVYRARSLHTPGKWGGLAQDTSIWGTGPEPGRLLTIGCLQPADPSQPSSQNVVVVWAFERVA